MPTKRYIDVVYQEGGQPYLYHNEEGIEFSPGDEVQVTTPAGAVRTVTVVTAHPVGYTPDSPLLSVTKPAFKVSSNA